MIWVNMDSTLVTLAPELGWELFTGEMRWRAKDMAGERRDKLRETGRGVVRLVTSYKASE